MDRADFPVVADCMTPQPYVVAADDPLPKANLFMQEHGIRHLPVMKGANLVGILSDRDLHLVQNLAHARPDEITVEDAMTADPYVVAPDTPLNHVARALARRKVGSALVVDEGRLVGVFTVTDGLQSLAETLEALYRAATAESAGARPR